MSSPSIAVLIPCYNESSTIADVIVSFRKYLPTASIYVYDNNSTDNTAIEARKMGAMVFREQHQGKGNVVRRMFADIHADIYVLVDGDNTYDAESAPHLIERLIQENLDMVVAIRKETHANAYRKGHILGNRLFNWVIKCLFGSGLKDIMSGYRVFSKRFVKTFPGDAIGFEIETELSVHALNLRLPIDEISTPYFARPSGSLSKLNTYKDGLKILCKIISLTKEIRPFFFFGTIGTILVIISIILGTPVIQTYIETGLVPRFPTAILAAVTMQLAFLCYTSGWILNSSGTSRRELKRLCYLQYPILNSKAIIDRENL